MVVSGGVNQWSEHLKLKQKAMGSTPGSCLGILFPLLSDVKKDLWCSSTVWLLSTQI